MNKLPGFDRCGLRSFRVTPSFSWPSSFCILLENKLVRWRRMVVVSVFTNFRLSSKDPSRPPIPVNIHRNPHCVSSILTRGVGVSYSSKMWDITHFHHHLIMTPKHTLHSIIYQTHRTQPDSLDPISLEQYKRIVMFRLGPDLGRPLDCDNFQWSNTSDSWLHKNSDVPSGTRSGTTPIHKNSDVPSGTGSGTTPGLRQLYQTLVTHD